MSDKDKTIKDYVAFDHLSPIQRAQLIRFYPELAKEEKDEIKLRGLDCP